MGYDNAFLSTTFRTPKLDNLDSAFLKDGSEIIDYTHFSLALSRTRKFAIWIAWNIDGADLKRLPRKGLEFYEDPRIPVDNQAGESLYKLNPLDRGHIARRADLLWGPREEAEKANRESFAFTNIAPQMDSFNQVGKGGVWGRLEDSLYDQVDMDRSRVSIVGGCIFSENDREYRGFKIPVEFFKTILYEKDGVLRTKSFVLTQDLSGLEFLDLELYKTFEVGPREIERKCSFKFDPAIREASEFDLRKFKSEKRRPLWTTDEIHW